jgi:hypothetical protein
MSSTSIELHEMTLGKPLIFALPHATNGTIR